MFLLFKLRFSMRIIASIKTSSLAACPTFALVAFLLFAGNLNLVRACVSMCAFRSNKQNIEKKS